eukprot:TRINITY_DN793_c0_g1_i2.p1 TRINITY_DN793_c0_g1~~TRINITY_DN793_c0_g1_i2.p1  ORF type:complete len:561 (-),score=68.01 TRINITY_DN793_c0_g1_i2:190-1872(-)
MLSGNNAPLKPAGGVGENSMGKGAGKGKIIGKNGLVEDGLAPPKVTVQTLDFGELVDVFHRYTQDPNGYFMVKNRSCGVLHPSVGWTDGWTEARINEAWSIERYNPSDYRTWIEIQWMHPLWYNRRGHRLDTSNAKMVTQRVTPEQIRKRDEPSEANETPRLTLVHIRWGGERPVNPVTEGAGGWGQIGSTPSDNYINGWEDTVFQTLGPTYEIISVFFQRSEELLKISPALLCHMARGKHIGALYFMWPIIFQDGHECPAYVERDKLFHLMITMEAAGLPTRFPHQSQFYRVLASKEWASQMCLHPMFRVPLTVQVSRQSVAMDPGKASTNAIKALQRLSETRSLWWEECGFGTTRAAPIQKGVTKLGWSWEAMDVQAWQNKHDLQSALSRLVEQPGSLVDQIFVQEWIDFDVEIRHFIVEADLKNPQSLKPKQRIYTIFKSKEGGSFRDFARFDRAACVRETFANDDEAMTDAERQCDELIQRWLQWVQAQTHELPVVMRMDILVKRVGPGKAAVSTGELTELGGCFLGWQQGPSVVFGAMLRSCLKDVALEPSGIVP